MHGSRLRLDSPGYAGHNPGVGELSQPWPTDGWGPQRRRAAVSVTFETLGPTAEGEAGVSPAVPTVLRILAERELSATFFADADEARDASLTLALIAAARNEIGALVHDADALAPTLSALHSAGADVRGLRAGRADAVASQEALAGAGLRYVQAPDGTLAIEGGIVRVPFDRRLTDAAFLAPALVAGDPDEHRHPGAWHQALQVAVGRAIEHGAHVTVTFFPGLLERADALAVFVETLDLVAGLRRADRLWTPTLDELAAWWLVR